ncbi:unnamed protein product [Rangifer tarandus platyrhynchus]|uniref:Uncharacterized protein n=2 Tax=Rangifer tarandus platyrhynchus TaxID=3082113 RepID=A0AC59YVD1_RANTA|nr:unnamed protein product [Rangifer tarandus platyrhynchus]
MVSSSQTEILYSLNSNSPLSLPTPFYLRLEPTSLNSSNNWNPAVLTLCESTNCSLPGSSGVGSHSFLQGNFPTQGSDSCLLHCRQILYRSATREAHKRL